MIDDDHRLEVGHAIVGRLLVERLAKGMRAEVAEYKLIAIGRRLRHAVGADRSTRPGNVLHHHLLIKNRLSREAKSRPTTSSGPPAANGTTIVTGRVGHSRARAGVIAITSVAKATMILMLGIDVPSELDQRAAPQQEHRAARLTNPGLRCFARNRARARDANRRRN